MQLCVCAALCLNSMRHDVADSYLLDIHNDSGLVQAYVREGEHRMLKCADETVSTGMWSACCFHVITNVL